MLGIDDAIVEFDCKNMKLIKNVKAKKEVFNIDKVNNDTILTSAYTGYI